MNATPAPGTTRTPETSTFRLYLMRGLYLLLALALGADIWPRVLGAGEPLGAMDGVAYAFWATLSLLAVVGIRYPLKMLPLLLVQMAYKSIWLLAVALPLWSGGTLGPAVADMTQQFLIGVALDLIVIPWPYVYRTFVRAPGARWKGMGSGQAPATSP